MIIKQYIKDFEKLGFGLFVHFGLYSVIGRGEWVKQNCDLTWDEYLKTLSQFNPKHGWADEIANAAKNAGCKYITLTARHHDGFSLYDTRGLNEYDSVHICGRDLVKEFVDACRKFDIIPFFYHTLIDWHEEKYRTDFKSYLKYLRESVEIICKNYGKIGGIWFDGMWEKPDDDWEEDELYGTIRKYQPDAMIINNTGLFKRGELGHIELDSVTFERGNPVPINMEEAPKYIASEMCEVFNDHWGYAKNDFNYKSAAEIIETFALCRRYRSNLLLNVGPLGDGTLRTIDKGLLEVVGDWIKMNEKAIRTPKPTDIIVTNKPKDFILSENDTYYLFVHDLQMFADLNVAIAKKMDLEEKFVFKKGIKSVCWMDNCEKLDFIQDGDNVTIKTKPYRYGESYVVRIIEIKV